MNLDEKSADLYRFLYEKNKSAYDRIADGARQAGCPAPAIFGGEGQDVDELSADPATLAKHRRLLVEGVLAEAIPPLEEAMARTQKRLLWRHRLKTTGTVIAALSTALLAFNLTGDDQKSWIPQTVALIAFFGSILTIIVDHIGKTSKQFWEVFSDATSIKHQAEMIQKEISIVGNIDLKMFDDAYVESTFDVVRKLREIGAFLDNEPYRSAD